MIAGVDSSPPATLSAAQVAIQNGWLDKKCTNLLYTVYSLKSDCCPELAISHLWSVLLDYGDTTSTMFLAEISDITNNQKKTKISTKKVSVTVTFMNNGSIRLLSTFFVYSDSLRTTQQ